MPTPIQFVLHRTGDLWRLERDGGDQGAYSHLEQGVHDAVQRARTLQEGGEPAEVAVVLDSGERIIVDTAPEAPNPDLAGGGAAFTSSRPL
jgi:hypothetical protein